MYENTGAFKPKKGGEETKELRTFEGEVSKPEEEEDPMTWTALKVYFSPRELSLRGTILE